MKNQKEQQQKEQNQKRERINEFIKRFDLLTKDHKRKLVPVLTMDIARSDSMEKPEGMKERDEAYLKAYEALCREFGFKVFPNVTSSFTYDIRDYQPKEATKVEIPPPTGIAAK